jgi:hypothetical protein
MIRIGKPVKLLEWGVGTTTLTQRWMDLAKGTLRAKPKVKAGITLLAVELDGPLQKQNEKDDWIKVVQQGEGMTPGSDKWGEVAMGRLKSVESEASKNVAYIELKNATKIAR